MTRQALLAAVICTLAHDVSANAISDWWSGRKDIQRVCVNGAVTCSDDEAHIQGNVTIVDEDFFTADDDLGDDLIGSDGSFHFCGKGRQFGGDVIPTIKILTLCKDPNPKDLCFREVSFELLDADFDKKHNRSEHDLGTFDLAKPGPQHGNVRTYCVDTRTIYEQIIDGWHVVSNVTGAVIQIGKEGVAQGHQVLDVVADAGKLAARGTTIVAEIGAGTAVDGIKRATGINTESIVKAAKSVKKGKK